MFGTGTRTLDAVIKLQAIGTFNRAEDLLYWRKPLCVPLHFARVTANIDILTPFSMFQIAVLILNRISCHGCVVVCTIYFGYTHSRVDKEKKWGLQFRNFTVPTSFQVNKLTTRTRLSRICRERQWSHWRATACFIFVHQERHTGVRCGCLVSFYSGDLIASYSGGKNY